MSTYNYSYTADAVRVIAIIAVITIHVSGLFVNFPIYFGSISWWFPNLIDSFSRVAVPLFIMLSGALLLDLRKGETHTIYFRKRIKRVGIPLLIWSIIYFLWRYYFWSDHLTFKQIFLDLISPYVYYHLYFLYVILGLYVLVPFLRILLSRLTKSEIKNGLVYLFTLAGVVYLLDAFFPNLKVGENGLTYFIPYIPYFIAGHFLWNKKINKNTFWIYFFLYLFLGISTSILNYFNMIYLGWTNQIATDKNYDRYFYEHFSSNVIIMSLISFVMLGNISKLFPKLGKKSNKNIISIIAPTTFGMYLIHPMIMDTFDRFFLSLNNLSIVVNAIWWMFPVKTFLVVITSFFLVYLLRKIKFLRIIFG